MTAQQMALPVVDMRPRCPLCGQPADVLGQYSPLWLVFVCRECTLETPYPAEVLIPSTRGGKDKSGLMVDPAAPHERRMYRVQCDEMIKAARRGYIDERPVKKFNMSGLELRNPIRRYDTEKYQRYHTRYLKDRAARQMQFPLCKRCGQPHGRMYEMLPGQTDYWSLCQRCEDETRVEALWRSRAIFGGDDPEAILDRLYPSFPDLFDRGVLPDYWFGLMKSEVSYAE